jgi:ubiquinone/menaquinone biosynthesis C-methylase UbiE
MFTSTTHLALTLLACAITKNCIAFKFPLLRPSYRLETARTMAESSSNNDKWAGTADLYSSQVSRLTELHGADLVSILKNDILKAKCILDIGCGTGAFAKAYLQLFPKGVPGQTLISSDFSEGMLQKAKETVKPGHDCQTKFVFQVEDGTKLDAIGNDSVDIVVSLFGVFLIPDQDEAFKAIARVLKRGGIFANGSWMFGKSDYFASQGFGVSLQDAFKLPNDIIDPSKNDNLAYLKWGSAADVKTLLAGHVPNDGSIQCYNAIHNTVSVDHDGTESNVSTAKSF